MVAPAPTTDVPHPSPRRGSYAVDAVILAFVLALVAGGVWFAQRSSAPLARSIEIDLSPWALPYYVGLSVLRGFIAYALSLVFAIVYGEIAAKNRRAERFMVPILDVLQGIPVLGFLPGLVLGMIALFPDSNVGLELACILMIFTGQVWNMVFSFYGSIRRIPPELEEVARVHRFSFWRRFRTLEMPASAMGLIWNSMVSMAGGWFFLTVNESFQLGGKDYRLPGIGSYMSYAYQKGDTVAVVSAILAMGLVIIVTDRLLWRPLIVWSHRFRLDEPSEGEEPERSWILSMVLRSRILRKRRTARRSKLALQLALAEPQPAPAPAPPRESVLATAPPPVPPLVSDAVLARVRAVIGWLVVAVIVLGSLYGAWALLTRAVLKVTGEQWVEILIALGLTGLRTVAALALTAAWTIPVGVWIGLSPRIAAWAQPVVQVVASFPAPMLFPLMTGLLVDRLGISFELGCMFLTLFGMQWYVLFNVIAGTLSLPHDLREVATVSGVQGTTRWKLLLLPGIFPQLLTGLITATGGAWNACIVAEYQHLESGRLVTAHGLGSLISRATDAGDFPLLAAAILALVLTLVALNRFVWDRLHHLAEERFSLNQ